MADPSSPTGVAPDRSVHVVVSDEQNEVPVDADRWAALAVAALLAEGCVGELTLTFVDRDEMAELNAEHMGEDGPTDVLSFPLDPFGGDAPGPSLIGDLVICPAVAAESAPDHAGNLDDELALLTVHGVLHICGHDHADPDEAASMRERERALLVELHWGGPAPAGFRQVHDEPDGDEPDATGSTEVGA
ncbi:MAG TPA: rRNA maturation RNase YbeY [Ilumatobacter sp.]|nr:rRNA maturation RNase YbeY [Ilumatobacter sp.]